MRMRLALILTACVCASAYLVSKLDLALRGELGLPGFPADAASYAQYDPLWGQVSNAAASLVLIAVMAGLFAPPRIRALRWSLFAVNWIALLMVAIGAVTFTARAAGWAPSLGAPAIGWQSWVTVAIGYVWVVSWAGALLIPAGRLTTPARPSVDRGRSGSSALRTGQP